MPRRKKRRAAWGSLVEVEPSVWRLRYWSTGPDGYKRRSRTIRGSRKDAERVRAELMLAHSEDAPCPTVGDVWRTYALPTWERMVGDGDLAAQTLAVRRSAWNRHVAPTWDAVQCDGVRPLAVQQWLDTLNYSQAKISMFVLRAVMDYAVRYEYVDHSPMRERYVMPSKSTIDRRDAGVWTLDELGEVWRAVRGEWFEAAYLLAAFGGLRVGESLGVRSDDVTAAVVDGQTLAMVRVERQVMNIGGRVSDALKNEQSRRTVAIPGRAGARLLALASAADGFLTGDGFGGPTKQRILKESWHRAQGAMDARLVHPFQNLRNSWQTWMRWEMRVEPWAIEAAMGHLAPGVTGRHYDRPQADVVAEVIAEAYAQRPYDDGWN